MSDKLFELLASPAATADAAFARQSAAAQLGEFVRAHGVRHVRPLLRRVRPLLRSREWETRLAAAAAVRSLCDAWAAMRARSTIALPLAAVASRAGSESCRLTFEELDMQQVLHNGRPLLASGGAEFDVDWSAIDPRERVRVQRQLLKQVLYCCHFL